MDDILQWFSLKSVPGIGNHLFKRLIKRFESPQAVFDASVNDLLIVDGISQRVAISIKNHSFPDWVEAELQKAAKRGYRIVVLTDAEYPPLLREIPDPPPYLYVSGRLGEIEPSISVVGSRIATSYGIDATQELCMHLAQLNFTIVSGMAKGIDTAAHKGALMGKGKTVAVLGSGLGRIYPWENRELFKNISETGAVVSEFPLQAEPDPHNFPIRNRIISGMSLGTVIVEATKKSGSLITARLAAEQNREVFAVPGNIHSFKSTGTHSLIKQGAKLVENAQDILDELSALISVSKPTQKPAPPPPSVSLTDQEKQIIPLLEPYPVHIDDLVRKSGMGAGRLSSILLTLELKGLVKQTPGKRFFLTTDGC
jgi:DNA processing protein